MATSKRIPERSEVRTNDTWDLRPLFKNDAEWEKAFKQFEASIPKFESFRGRLGKGPKILRAYYEFESAFDRESERLQHYAFLKSAEDVGNSRYQAMFQRYIHVATHAQEAVAFVAPEIQALSAAQTKAYLASKELARYRFLLEKLLRYKPHILSEPEERLLAMQGEVAGSADRIFEQLNDADLKFGTVADERGRRVELTQSSFRSLLDSPKRSVRKEAFNQFYAQYDAHKHALAATLGSSVLQDVYGARARNHASCLHAALFADDVPPTVYDSLIKAVRGGRSTIYRYLELRRKALKLKDIHMYDTYVPLGSMRRIRTPYPKAVEIVCEALSPLGTEYVETMRQGLLEGRWVDRYENRGKRSGAFSAGGFDGPPYILLNYQEDSFDSVFTLAHEAGHSMHTWYSVRNQPYHYYNYTIFAAEVASTFNELLLNDYLLSRAEDPQMRAYLINREIDELRGTLIRQTMFAEFEKIIHAAAEAGEALTLDLFQYEYRRLLETYFGPGFTIDPALTIEGLRIPHFYHAFYVYKYATGISAAAALSDRVLRGGGTERRAYLAFLGGGGSKFPLNLLRDAGVDMESPKPVATAMARFKKRVKELEELV